MAKNENKEQSFAQIYNSSEAINNRERLRKEINSHPRGSFGGVFKKDDKERGEFLTERYKWRKHIKAFGETKRGMKMKTYLKVS